LSVASPVQSSGNSPVVLLIMSSGGFFAYSAEDLQELVTTTGCAEYKPLCIGDFYQEPDDVVRGLTLPFGCGSSHLGGGELSFGDMCDGDKMSHSMCLGTFSDFADHFDAEYKPPVVSEEIQAFLESTSLQLSNHSPIAAGNDLLSFLRNEIDAKVNKVSKNKFTLRAEVFVGGLWCSIKVRIYEDGGGSIMEIQRRSGDSISFFSLYRQVSEHFLGSSSLQTVSSSPLKVPDIPSFPANQGIAPLLDMADSCGDTNVLAEVASTLNAMAADPAVAAELRMPRAIAVLEQLSQVSDFRVSFPTSQLLSCM